MFTGLIETLATVTRLESLGGDVRLHIQPDDARYLQGGEVGASIATSGVCLTAVAFENEGYVADVSVETLNVTTVKHWQAGTRLNLERSLTLQKPLGGHVVSGHVDGLATLIEAFEEARSWRLRFAVPPALARYIAKKGSVALDGISLTVNDVERRGDLETFGVNIVPHTWTHTTLGTLPVGGTVNLEVDLLARYAERLTDPSLFIRPDFHPNLHSAQ
jgi:riboflavin synthase